MSQNFNKNFNKNIDKARKVISWNISEACNYRCSYCSQGKKDTRIWDPTTGDIRGIKRFFGKLGPGWEVKISGGEPFHYPGLLELSAYLVTVGNTVSVVTNFSFPFKTYKKFLRITGPSLRVFSASLHLEQTDWKKFLKKCQRLKKKIDKLERASLVVNSVVVPGKVEPLVEIKAAFEERGIRFYPQLMRKKGKNVGYGDQEMAIIKTLAGSKGLKSGNINAGLSMKGKECRAGLDYFIIDERGQCFTCYPGRRDRSGYLGNIADDSFKPYEAPIVCPYEICPCTVPLNRGIVARSSDE